MEVGVVEIEISGVAKRFTSEAEEEGLLALSETNLSIQSGETVSLVGPSGCGKTTLLNLVAGFMAPSEGVIRVRGERVREPGPDRTVVFQADAVFPWLTVRENLSYGPRMRAVPASTWRPRVEKFIDLVGLKQFADSYPKVLSGGMKKRVDLARAYVSDPAILLMDEPFGALDEFTKQTMEVDLLHIVEQDRKTIIFVTHDVEEALFIGDRIVVMSPRPGRVVASIPVPFEHPRPVGIRTTPKFQALRRDILVKLGFEELT